MYNLYKISKNKNILTTYSKLDKTIFIKPNQSSE